MLLGPAQNQLIRHERDAAIRHDPEQRHVQPRVKCQVPLFPHDPSGHLEHILPRLGTPGVHHPAPYDLVRVRHQAGAHLGDARRQEQVRRALLPRGRVGPRLGLEKFVYGELNCDVAESHEGGRQSPPEHGNAPLGVQAPYGSDDAVRPALLEGLLEIVQRLRLHPRPDEEHGVADGVGHRAGHDGRSHVDYGRALAAPNVADAVPSDVPPVQLPLELLIEGEVNAPEEGHGRERRAQPPEAPPEPVLLDDVSNGAVHAEAGDASVAPRGDVPSRRGGRPPDLPHNLHPRPDEVEGGAKHRRHDARSDPRQEGRHSVIPLHLGLHPF
mmetsp:Transcript_29842/g.88603  ORF Transcript_29842/g.88603 Transcript_29842/m.88603 type:complete len:327 (-) Transcript_29842:558-1538(-)